MKVVWSDPAISDLEAVRDYISRDSESNACRFLSRLIESVDILERFPEAGQILPEYAKWSLRELVHRNYRIIYQCRVDHVRILAVVHAARNIDLLNLLNR
jgi:plasmid stabilization system protein ParE